MTLWLKLDPCSNKLFWILVQPRQLVLHKYILFVIDISYGLFGLYWHYRQSYTSANGERYKIPDEMISVGLLVAAIFPEDSNWHRCVITALKSGQYVEVRTVTDIDVWSSHLNQGNM